VGDDAHFRTAEVLGGDGRGVVRPPGEGRRELWLTEEYGW